MRQEQLVEAISKKRDEMIKLGMGKGLQCEETINCSQELDELLNDYSRLLSEDKRSNPLNEYHDFLIFLQKHVYKVFLSRYRNFFNYLQH